MGININVCPPHRPDKNAFVERYHRSYSEECLAVYRPTNLDEVVNCTLNYAHHYNHERPNQALTCGNRPPLDAWPDLPQGPKIPNKIDSDRWLHRIDSKLYKRKVSQNGSIQIGRQSYYVSSQLRKCSILIRVNATEKVLEAIDENKIIKTLPIKGLTSGTFCFDEYNVLIKKDAISGYQAALRKKRF